MVDPTGRVVAIEYSLEGSDDLVVVKEAEVPNARRLIKEEGGVSVKITKGPAQSVRGNTPQWPIPP